MTNKFNFKIISGDGKVYSNSISELYVETTNGVIGILCGHLPLIATLPISVFHIKIDKDVVYFAISGGLLNVEKESTYILADTYEISSEIDKDRVLKTKEKAENKIKSLTKDDEYDLKAAEFSLKKAINRLRLIK